MNYTALALSIGVFFGSALAAIAETPLRLINVTGTAQIAAEPDMATVQIGVTHEDRAATRAMALTAEGAGEVLARLQTSGIAPRDVQTGTVSLDPIWSDYGSSNKKRQITGFVARVSMTVRVREIALLGTVLDAVVSDGANQLGGIRFGFQDPDPLMAEARRQAVADGQARAALLAEAAGVTLGPLQSISDHGGEGRPMMMDMRMASESAIPIAAGEVSLSASVSMVYAIAD